MRLLYFKDRAVNYEQVFVSLQRGLILNHAVFGNAHAVHPRADRAGAAHQDRTLKRSDNPGDHGTSREYRTDTRHNEQCRTEKQAPEAAPKKHRLLPQYFIRVRGVVITHDMFISVVLFPHNRQLFHVDSGAL